MPADPEIPLRREMILKPIDIASAVLKVAGMEDSDDQTPIGFSLILGLSCC